MGPQSAVSSPLNAPWALARVGRPRPGRRAASQLFYLTSAVTSGGQVKAWHGTPVLKGRVTTYAPRRIEPADIVATFRRCPARRAIVRARAELPIAEPRDGRLDGGAGHE